MPSYRMNSKHPKGRPWLARVQMAGKRQDLGYYATEEEAEAVETAHGRTPASARLGREQIKPGRRNLAEPVKSPFIDLA